MDISNVRYNMFPMPITTAIENITPPLSDIIFKYKIGQVFHDTRNNDVVEITGFNYNSKTYKGNVTYTIGGKETEIESNLIFESRLDRMTRYDSMLAYRQLSKDKKETVVNYRIYYFSKESKTQQSATQYNVSLSNVRALARLLNSLVKMGKRVVLVSVVDDSGKFIDHVKFLKKEIDEQKFLTGMKERLLAHAKYECGYEVATNF